MLGNRGLPEARSAFAYAEASFLMTFAMGGVPHAGSQHRMPEELWMEIHDVAQEAVKKTISKKKKCKKAKWLSEKALQIAEKRREAKGKGEKERNTYLNAEFQKLARRDKKAFSSGQWKELKENKRMRKTRDLFKKISVPREY